MGVGSGMGVAGSECMRSVRASRTCGGWGYARVGVRSRWCAGAKVCVRGGARGRGYACEVVCGRVVGDVRGYARVPLRVGYQGGIKGRTWRKSDVVSRRSSPLRWICATEHQQPAWRFLRTPITAQPGLDLAPRHESGGVGSHPVDGDRQQNIKIFYFWRASGLDWAVANSTTEKETWRDIKILLGFLGHLACRKTFTSPA